MNATTHRQGLSWSARLLIALALVMAGAAAATWALARYETAARALGVAKPGGQVAANADPITIQPQFAAPMVPMVEEPMAERRVAELENRVERVESVTTEAVGSADRADALLVAFAARRAIDRGVPLGYIENLLVGRFGRQHRRAVATVITASHQPVPLRDLIDEYEALGPDLRRGGPQSSWFSDFKRELGSLVEVHRAGQPSTDPEARYDRALERLRAGEVDQALVETMRLPGAARASGWTAKARRYIAAHRALDQIESAALLAGTTARR